MNESQALSENQVRHIASLSRLALSDEEVSRYAKQMGDILAYASNLPELHDHTESLAMRLDEDTAQVRDNPHDLLANAAALENGYVKVPAILDKSES